MKKADVQSVQNTNVKPVPKREEVNHIDPDTRKTERLKKGVDISSNDIPTQRPARTTKLKSGQTDHEFQNKRRTQSVTDNNKDTKNETTDKKDMLTNEQNRSNLQTGEKVKSKHRGRYDHIQSKVGDRRNKEETNKSRVNQSPNNQTLGNNKADIKDDKQENTDVPLVNGHSRGQFKSQLHSRGSSHLRSQVTSRQSVTVRSRDPTPVQPHTNRSKGHLQDSHKHFSNKDHLEQIAEGKTEPDTNKPVLQEKGHGAKQTDDSQEDVTASSGLQTFSITELHALYDGMLHPHLNGLLKSFDFTKYKTVCDLGGKLDHFLMIFRIYVILSISAGLISI